MAKNWNPSWALDVGINHVPAYQVSGEPFAQHLTLSAATKTKVDFPYVTRWVQVTNHGSNDVKIGFSSNGINKGNYIVLSGDTVGSTRVQQHQTVRLELKVSQLWMISAGTPALSVVAGLTSIDKKKVSGSIGPNWSGSAGVG